MIFGWLGLPACLIARDAVPANALRDDEGNPILDDEGNYILTDDEA